MAMSRRRLWIGLLAGALAALCITAALVAREAFFPEKLNVVSIATTQEYQDPALLARAWQLPAAATFIKGFTYQANGSVCGPTSLADVEHSLGDQAATTKSLLTGTGLCQTGVCMGGITLDQLAELTRSQAHRKVTLLRDLTLAQFREHMRQSNTATRRYTINFHRGQLFGQGHGHHSPIGGYLEDRDLVFVLDVNQKFKPWLAPSARVFAAMDTVDSSTGKKRGLLLIE
jgi:hypothetical protein